MLQRRFDPRLHLRAGALVEIGDDGVFRRVVIVGRAGGDFGFWAMSRMVVASKPFFAEEFQGGIENPAAGLFGFRRVLGEGIYLNAFKI
jgi:hypothetical protein